MSFPRFARLPLSLRGKILLFTVILQGIMLIMLLLADLLLVEPWFVARTHGAMRRAAAEISRIPDAGREMSHRELSRFGAKTPFKLTATDGSGRILDSSSPEFTGNGELSLPKEQGEYLASHRRELDRGSVLTGICSAASGGVPSVLLMAALGNSRYLVITEPLDSLRDNVRSAAGFFLIIGTALLLLSALGAALIALTFTRPIRELTSLAGDIAALDFSKRWEGTSRDEIGELGASINRIAERLDRAFRDLRAGMDRQRRFLADVSHDLKTPLGLISGYAEMLAIPGMTAEERERALGIITEETDRLIRLIGEVIALARSDSESVPLRIAETDLGTLLRRLPERFEPALPKKGLYLLCEIPSGNWLVAGDPDRLTEALDNAISNAVRHAREGSAVTVRLAPIGDDSGKHLEISIENRGPTLPEEELERVFDPFYRVDRDRSRENGGFGLGLAILRGIAEAHGGTARLENRSDGIRCIIRLPRT